ncbi:hypothetical protein CZ787_14385 [Halomonas citrativorans]|uniref:Uncharacterized protein n=1 Tax=Halomonas citrativorans TaxID=2742612 RepID=A0A1R4I3I6_9GAMM|nr:hypothetical protein CZ787_14385 [Halomonas citrativorans]
MLDGSCLLQAVSLAAAYAYIFTGKIAIVEADLVAIFYYA